MKIATSYSSSGLKTFMIATGAFAAEAVSHDLIPHRGLNSMANDVGMN